MAIHRFIFLVISFGIYVLPINSCSQLASCATENDAFYQSATGCVNHPYCRYVPVCYSSLMTTKGIRPVIQYSTRIPNISAAARWIQNGVIIAGSYGEGYNTNQLSEPLGLFVDDDQTMIIADSWNHRIIQWKKGDTDGTILAGGHGEGNRSNQLNSPTDMLVDKETKNLIICDRGNQRVVQWSLRRGTTKGKVLLDKIFCYGLAMDDQRYLYVTDIGQNEVRRYKIGEKNGTIVAGGNGPGDDLNQLEEPIKIFVDQKQTVYISDNRNNRVVKWNKGAKTGTVVAGGQAEGDALTQLFSPIGLVVDRLGTIYVADTWNHRIVRWPKGAKQGTVIAGKIDSNEGENQFEFPVDLSFDRDGNLYVVDWGNHRVKRFSIEKTKNSS
ncbi:unnamed protein product [Rotaria magnacalcarata]|uniref:Uncharacterized protein n=1 Tax=Rotaria magnacalcarata TaxID=392030 RepID=A0A816MTT1_9BILA|nr:unnamed protein product [Rotaria magnacalcarata]CAF1407692.1 unnamed protein product [Rotaria magnacalcarata]CAF2003923.1 unnamed protein product [Rotaria magnacalcarata]CAF2068769.1 unnamed protein product [Rotaria magnacalcarata]CAF2073211.1 unnamed protein product [Rotaria magnacalcarata]